LPLIYKLAIKHTAAEEKSATSLRPVIGLLLFLFINAGNKRSPWLKGWPMFRPLGSMEKMRGLPRLRWRRARKANEREPFSMAFYGVWEAVARFAAEIRSSDFMAEMSRRRGAYGTHGLMGPLDCATLYALARWQRPAVVVESGGFVGMSSAFILKAFADEGLTSAKLYSIEWNQDCKQGALVPDELQSQFVPLRGKVEDFVQGDRLPASIDMFLHDSSHSRQHMLW